MRPLAGAWGMFNEDEWDANAHRGWNNAPREKKYSIPVCVAIVAIWALCSWAVILWFGNRML